MRHIKAIFVFVPFQINEGNREADTISYIRSALRSAPSMRRLTYSKLTGGRSMNKRERGAYYTAGNPFNNPAFKRWAAAAKLPMGCILEPFAGANSLIDTLIDMGLCKQSASFDIEPSAKGVRRRDTLKNFPKGYDICIYKPPVASKE